MQSLTDSVLPERILDLLIVGLGPAGVACALQARREELDLIAIGDEPIGGLVRAARRLNNLPGLPGCGGEELAARMQRQLRDLGVACVQGTVEHIDKCAGEFVARCPDGRSLRARAVCLATGTIPRPWDLCVDAGVARDVRGLPERLEGAPVVVVGGGEAALDTALSCLDRGGQVTVFVRGAQVRGSPALLREAKERGLVLRTGAEVTAVEGVPGDLRLHMHDGEWLRVSHLVVCIGRVPRDGLALSLHGTGAGFWLAGDLSNGADRYVSTACGDGQRAALAVLAHLRGGRT